MARCKIHGLSPSYCYKRFKCRCGACIIWKKESANRTNNKERARERSRIWRLKNTERSRYNSKIYQRTHPEKVLEWRLKTYGLTLEGYYTILRKQGNICAICGGKPQGMQHGYNRLCVDHDDETGKVRGLLCGYCNLGLGNFRHSKRFLKNAIKYLNGDI